MLVCSLVGAAALFQILGHPPHVWAQMGLTPHRRTTLIVLLFPVLGPLNLAAAIYYWSRFGARAGSLETDGNIS